MNHSTLPEIVGSTGFALLAPVIDTLGLIGFEPSVFFVHLCQFRQTVASGSHPDIRIVEIMNRFLDGQWNGSSTLIVVERIFGSGILEEVRQIILAGRNVPRTPEVVSREDTDPLRFSLTGGERMLIFR